MATPGRQPKRRPAWRLAIYVSGAVLALWVVAYAIRTPSPDAGKLAQEMGAQLTPPPPEPSSLMAVSAAPQLAPGLASIEVVVRRNDTLDRIFRQLEISLADLASLRALDAIRPLLDRLRPGETLHFQHRNGSLYALQRDISLTERLEVSRTDDGLEASIVDRPIERRTAVARGIILNSLFKDGGNAGLSDPTILEFARIFGWSIDFVLDLREGDEFVVDYERLYQDGHYLQDGEILAARFVNQGKLYEAVRYVSPQGKARYYTPDGHSMEKAFLRAPLEFRRISSSFSLGRYHPILNRIRAHKGIDYAAPSGTPVRAAGDGTVRFRGVKGGYGNVIELQHGGGIVTVYGHLSRFAKGLQTGRSVQQGETIGYVGMSGLATGPHLHYEYRVSGQHRNPATVPLPEAKSIEPELRADFLAQTAPYLDALAPALVATSGGGGTTVAATEAAAP